MNPRSLSRPTGVAARPLGRRLRAALRPVALAPALLVATLFAALPFVSDAQEEQILLGLSQNRVSINASFDGTEILIFGAVKRDAPPPLPPLDVVITVKGPSESVMVMRKGRVGGIWVNTDQVLIKSAPSFYSVSTSAPLDEIMTATEDLRYRVSIPHVLRSIIAQDGVEDQESFVDGLIRIQEKAGNYVVDPGSVSFEEETLFSTDVTLPSNLTEGIYGIKVYLTRDGKVVSTYESGLRVSKVGMEQWLFNLSRDHAVSYAILAIAIAVFSGWAASEVFRLLRK